MSLLQSKLVLVQPRDDQVIYITQLFTQILILGTVLNVKGTGSQNPIFQIRQWVKKSMESASAVVQNREANINTALSKALVGHLSFRSLYASAHKHVLNEKWISYQEILSSKFEKHSLSGIVSNLGAETWDWRCLGQALVKT